MNNWNQDLENGELGQSKWVSYVLKNHPQYKHLHTSKEGDADEIFDIGDKKISFEVKTDLKVIPPKKLKNGLVVSLDTGNIFIEFHNKYGDKPSGISTTKADYYVIYFMYIEEFWVISVQRLREIIESNDFMIVSGGDKYRALGYLISRSRFKDEFLVLQNK